MHYGLGQVPTELEHGAVGPVNETPGSLYPFISCPLPLITLLIPEITRLICYNRLPPQSHQKCSLYGRKKRVFSVDSHHHGLANRCQQIFVDKMTVDFCGPNMTQS